MQNDGQSTVVADPADAARRLRRWRRIGIGGIVVVALIVLCSLAGSAFVTPGTKERDVDTATVQDRVRRQAEERGGKVQRVSCQEQTRDIWTCSVGLTDGRTVTGRAQWHPRGRVLGVSVAME